MFTEAVKLFYLTYYYSILGQRDLTKYFVPICLVKQFSTDFYKIMEEENVAHSKMKI